MVTIHSNICNNKNSTFCPHSVFMCFVWIWEQTAIISLYSINWLVFITETECVYCAVRTGSLYIILRSAHTDYIWVLYGSQNKQRLFSYAALTGAGSAVGIPTRYGFESPGIEFRKGTHSPHPSRQALRSTQPSKQWVPDHSRGLRGQGVESTIHPHPESRSKKKQSYTSTPRLGIDGLF